MGKVLRQDHLILVKKNSLRRTIEFSARRKSIVKYVVRSSVGANAKRNKMTTFTSEDRKNAEAQLTLVKYRDAGMATYTYFWKTIDNRTISPFFDSEKDAKQWMTEEVSRWDNFKMNKDL